MNECKKTIMDFSDEELNLGCKYENTCICDGACPMVEIDKKTEYVLCIKNYDDILHFKKGDLYLMDINTKEVYDIENGGYIKFENFEEYFKEV